MSHIQMPAVAGMFYPADPRHLAGDIDGMLTVVPDDPKPSPKAIIAPHAGYIYSGPIAASAYARWRLAAGEIKRVIVMAPSHRIPFNGIAASSANTFRTPLGDVPVDCEAVDSVLDLPGVATFDPAFNGEHALEVQLPFLQTVLPHFKLVPFIVGSCNAATVAAVLERLWGGDETRIAISSDLSHYLDYDSAVKRDRHTTTVIEALDSEGLADEDACGRNPVKGLLLAARQHGLEVETVDLRNSGDTAGPRDRVVGYGAYVFR